ncbi:LuxR C-terminal-related transcriptional regulator [Actinomycetes bacterium KLBMP 9797]
MIRQMGTLPAELTSFVGRRQERVALKRLLAASRLVTVTGVGGVGKTRTALRVATELRHGFPDGVWWVELSALADGDLLANTVAQALGLADQTARPQARVLAGYLADRQPLLVLDTCEHLVQPCAELVDTLLRAAPGLRVLATSRQPLGVAGEQLFALAPLPVPGSGPPEESPALELLVERAQAVDANFVMCEATRAAAATLCRRLDGIPLAIELAAVRLRTLSAEQLVAGLDDRFRLLSRGGRGRHETLRAAIGWSHELCSPAERLLWARVSVFAGDFDLAAAERVCADDRLPADGLVDVVAGLVDKSILLRAGDAGAGGATTARYRLLDTIREYGARLLDGAGERDRLRRRHRDHYLALARDFGAAWCGPDQVAWCRRLRQEHANLRAALDYCVTTPAELGAGLEMAGALGPYWMACGFLREGRHYLDRALALRPPPGRALTTALWVCAWIAAPQGDLAAASARLAQCRQYAEELDDPVALGWVASLAGAVAMIRGDLAGAVAWCQRSAERHRRGGDPGLGLLSALTTEAITLAVAGEYDRALAVTEDIRVVCDRHGERWIRAYADYVSALAEVARGDHAAADGHARAALRTLRELADSLGTAMALDVLAAVAAARGAAHRAARLLGAAHRVWHTFGLPQFGAPDFVAARQHAERRARAALGDQPYAAAFASGRALDHDAALAYALDERPTVSAVAPAAVWAPLTRREREIAELIAAGLTDARIADRLAISRRTAESHVDHVRTKLGFTNRAQIAAWATIRRAAEDPTS